MDNADTKDDLVAKVRERDLHNEGWVPKCKTCGWTPANVGWCEQCGYNRNYEMVRTSTLQ